MTFAPERASFNGSRSKLSRARKLAALVLALLSDALSVFAEAAPPLEWALDGATVLALVLVLGPRWPLLPAVILEAIPGLAAFPSWTLAVGAWLTLERRRQ